MKKNFNIFNYTLLIFSFFSSPILAVEEIQSMFAKHYGLDTESPLNSCETCHSPATTGFLNPYGLALGMHKLDFSKVGLLDSDFDGVINNVEIANSTWPGSRVDKSSFFIYKPKSGRAKPIKFDHEKHIKISLNNGKSCNDSCHAPGRFMKFFDSKVPGDESGIKKMVHDNCRQCHFNTLEVIPGDCGFCHKTL